jgi:hypothetical protein
MSFTPVLLMKGRNSVVMHASIWILVTIYARHKMELGHSGRKKHESATTKEES